MAVNRTALAALALLATGLPVVWSSAADARPTATRAIADKKGVAHAVESFRAAMVRADGKTLTHLAAPNLSFGHSNGLVQTRAQFVQSVVGKKEIFKKIDLVNQKVTIYGRTAISRHEFHADILLDGKPLNVKLKCIEVWDKTPSGWKLVSRQAYKTS
ncbi:MAG: nuclear transport factor 2 family protein [Hyphomicrobiaceae bacterium]